MKFLIVLKMYNSLKQPLEINFKHKEMINGVFPPEASGYRKKGNIERLSFVMRYLIMPLCVHFFRLDMGVSSVYFLLFFN